MGTKAEGSLSFEFDLIRPADLIDTDDQLRMRIVGHSLAAMVTVLGEAGHSVSIDPKILSDALEEMAGFLFEALPDLEGNSV